MHILCMICVQLSFCPDDMRETSKYANEIISVLCEAGDNGLPVRKIALHVFNTCNTLFAPVLIDDVHHDVRIWLKANSQSTDSLVRRCDKRGNQHFIASSTATDATVWRRNNPTVTPGRTTEQPTRNGIFVRRYAVKANKNTVF